MALNIDPIAFMEQQYGIKLKRVAGTEWAGPCPWCGGTDRFHVWEEGNYWCRPGSGHCARKGWVDELDGSEKLTKEALVELRLQRLESQQRDLMKRVSTLERMARCKDHIRYHNELHDQARGWWHSEGINDQSIASYRLGYCFRCPTDREGRPSYTIPVINGGKLYNIRHRLANSTGGDKYRPHMAGLPATLFNMDFLYGQSEIVIVEGEKKSIVLDQYGIPNVAIMGCRSFKHEWLDAMADLQRVYVALDPDAMDSSFRLAALFNGRGRVAQFPVKPDDFFYKYGGNVDDFYGFLKVAKPA